MLTYLDDILIHSPTREGALELLKIVLERLKGANLTVNLKKCDFFLEELEYLGHIINGDGLKPNARKIQALKALERPRDIKGVQRILGLFGYYHDFISHYADLTEPLVALLRNKKTFVWDDKHDEALEKLKDSLCEVVLGIPLDGDDFLLETDASDYAVSGILSVVREGKNIPVEFGSHMLSEQQRRWPTREKEAYAIVWSLRRYEEYLRGRRVRIHTDHQSLQWFLKATKGKLSRWAQCLTDYTLNIYHKKGIELVHVDSLSRNPEPEEYVEDRMVYYVESHLNFGDLPTPDKLREWTSSQEQLPDGVREQDGFAWYRRGIYVPEEMRDAILDYFHSNALFIHPGVTKTIKKIQKIFDWPYLHLDVRTYIKGCLTCQRNKSGMERKQGLMHVHPERLPFEVIHVDLWGPIEDENGEKVHILSIIDRATRWAEAVIVENKKSEVVLSALLTTWCCRYGFPSKLITDQDPTFTEAALQNTIKQMGIDGIQTSVYHPEGNAPVETFHRSLKKGLMSFRQQEGQISLHEALQLTMFGYRSSVNLTTQETPSYLTFGLDITLPPENEWHVLTDERLQNRLKMLSNLRFEVMNKARIVAENKLNKVNEVRKDSKFSMGDLILVRLTGSQLDQLARLHANRKLLPKWSIPCRVVNVGYQGRTAHCRNLLTNEMLEVHIQNVKFIGPPVTKKQQMDWIEGIAEGLDTFTDDGQRERLLQKYWEEVKLYSEDNDLPSRAKRDRLDSLESPKRLKL